MFKPSSCPCTSLLVKPPHLPLQSRPGSRIRALIVGVLLLEVLVELLFEVVFIDATIRAVLGHEMLRNGDRLARGQNQTLFRRREVESTEGRSGRMDKQCVMESGLAHADAFLVVKTTLAGLWEN